mgnify:CR=1 FL=1
MNGEFYHFEQPALDQSKKQTNDLMILYNLPIHKHNNWITELSLLLKFSLIILNHERLKIKFIFHHFFVSLI